MLLCDIGGVPLGYVTQLGLKVNLVLLIDRQSTMGPIEANTATTLEGIHRTNTNMTIILVVVVVAALVFALLISWLLTVSLSRLAFGMDMLVIDVSNSTLSQRARVYSLFRPCAFFLLPPF